MADASTAAAGRSRRKGAVEQALHEHGGGQSRHNAEQRVREQLAPVAEAVRGHDERRPSSERSPLDDCRRDGRDDDRAHEPLVEVANDLLHRERDCRNRRVECRRNPGSCAD
jgi:hypothetical protein